MRKTLATGLVFIASASALGAVAYSTIPSDAEAGDPARWYQPADTPAKKYEVAMKEARAALKEAMTACRSEVAAERRPCMTEALRTYRDDAAEAKSQRDSY